VQVVDDLLVELQQSGGLKDLNREFKAAREAGAAARYRDFLFEKKMGMLEAIARMDHGG
jgi:hypothetical protein